MKKMEAKAPGVVKLFGEHAVVYGKLALGVAIDLYATARLTGSKRRELRITLLDLEGRAISLDENKLKDLYESYKKRKSISNYIEKNGKIDLEMLPYATIAARLANEFGLEVTEVEVEITSKIPKQSGCASSAACSTAFAVALIKNSGSELDDATVIDIARDGERISHKSEGAGRIDVATSYYGGYVSTAGEGRREQIKAIMDIILIDTGPKKSTAETVGTVRKLYDKDREATEKRLAEIEKCTIEGIKALSDEDLELAGRYMYRDHELLRDLGVSSKGLDKAVEIAKENKAYGAKLSGGGGGGLAIAVSKDPKILVKALMKERFGASIVGISFEGAKDFL